MANTERQQAGRRPEGKEDAGAQQEVRNSQQAGKNRPATTNRTDQPPAQTAGDRNGRKEPSDKGLPGFAPTSPNDRPVTARDREAGRDANPSGDLGMRGKTWTPPPGAQGISNRPDDDPQGGSDDDIVENALADSTESEEQLPLDTAKGGDKSNRAAVSGATGERHPGGGRNKPAPKNQDEKGQAGLRNRR